MDKYFEEFCKIWDFLVENNISTEDELCLACGLLGESVDTLNRVIFYKTGYRDLEQLREYEDLPTEEVEIPF